MMCHIMRNAETAKGVTQGEAPHDPAHLITVRDAAHIMDHTLTKGIAERGVVAGLKLADDRLSGKKLARLKSFQLEPSGAGARRELLAEGRLHENMVP